MPLAPDLAPSALAVVKDETKVEVPEVYSAKLTLPPKGGPKALVDGAGKLLPVAPNWNPPPVVPPRALAKRLVDLAGEVLGAGAAAAGVGAAGFSIREMLAKALGALVSVFSSVAGWRRAFTILWEAEHPQHIHAIPLV